MQNASKRGKARGFAGNFAFLKGNLLVLTISWMFWFPALRLTEGYAQLYIVALGASTAILGMVSSISTATLSVGRIFGGYVADRFGRKRILTTMTFAIASTYLIYAFAPSWEWILIAGVLQHVFLLYQPALIALRADSVPSEKRGFGFALTEFLPGLISIPAPIIATYLVVTNGTVAGMRTAYILGFAFGIGAGLTQLFLKETLPERSEKRLAGFKEDFRKEYSNAIRFIFKNMRNIALLYIIFNFAFVGVSPLFSIFAARFIGLGNEGWGIMYTVSYIFYLALLVPIGFVVDRFGRRKILLLSLSFLTSFSLIFAIAPLSTLVSLFLLVAAYCAIVLAYTAYVNSISALEADYIPKEKRGRVTAALAFVASLAGAAGQALGGFEYDSIHPRFPFFVLTAFMILSLFVIFFKIEEPKTREN